MAWQQQYHNCRSKIVENAKFLHVNMDGDVSGMWLVCACKMSYFGTFSWMKIKYAVFWSQFFFPRSFFLFLFNFLFSNFSVVYSNVILCITDVTQQHHYQQLYSIWAYKHCIVHQHDALRSLSPSLILFPCRIYSTSQYM